jgi:rare lipoprotein A (peptidoglycan hydrolase)
MLRTSGVTDNKINNSKYDVTSSVRGSDLPAPRARPIYRIGEPYIIAGRTYTPREQPGYSAKGVASWYGDKFHGRLTANGEIFDTFSLSAAHLDASVAKLRTSPTLKIAGRSSCA